MAFIQPEFDIPALQDKNAQHTRPDSLACEQIISLAFRLASNDNMSGVCSDTPVIKKQDTGMSELGRCCHYFNHLETKPVDANL